MGARKPGRRTMPATELGVRLGISARAARSYWAEPRACYEARSTSRAQPWAEAGISRATWYRRRKAAGQTSTTQMPGGASRVAPEIDSSSRA
jgi:hypothetical protein